MLWRLRDLQVQRMFFDAHAAQFPGLILILKDLKRRERKSAKEVARKVRHFRTRKVEEWICGWHDELLRWPMDARKQNKMTRDIFKATSLAFAEAVSCRTAIDVSDPETIHRTRVAFKNFRYMVEAISPDFTGLGKKQLRLLGNYQRRMGKLQDLEILEKCVCRFIEKNPEDKKALASFCRLLRSLQARALRSCLRHADDLFSFWECQTGKAGLRNAGEELNRSLP